MLFRQNRRLFQESVNANLQGNMALKASSAKLIRDNLSLKAICLIGTMQGFCFPSRRRMPVSPDRHMALTLCRRQPNRMAVFTLRKPLPHPIDNHQNMALEKGLDWSAGDVQEITYRPVFKDRTLSLG